MDGWIRGRSRSPDVQLLGRSEIQRLETDCTGAIIDRIVKRYRRTGGGDDGHPAYALYTLVERRRRAAAKGIHIPE